MVVTLAETADGAGTVMAIESRFPSAAAMEQLLAMGQEEGMVAALSQVEGSRHGLTAGPRRKWPLDQRVNVQPAPRRAHSRWRIT